MKNTPVSYCIAILIGLLFQLSSLPRAHAAGHDEGDIATLLTSGPWNVTFQKSGTLVRVFRKDGTFFTPDSLDESGIWKIGRDTIVLTHPDGRQEILALPLMANGTEGKTGDGGTLRAVLDNSSGLLVSAPWKITSQSVFNIREFARDGTFTTVGGDQSGTWDISDKVILTFKDGHKESLSLPLDPKGTAGFDKEGNPQTAVMQYPAAKFPPMDARATAAATTLLVSAPWKVKGSWWSTVRVFASDGTFSGPGGRGEHGTWKFSDGMVVLTFPDGHSDTFMLPLDPKGTVGADSKGGPTLAAVIDAIAEKNAPASAPAAAGKKPPAQAAQSPGSYFGTTHP